VGGSYFCFATPNKHCTLNPYFQQALGVLRWCRILLIVVNRNEYYYLYLVLFETFVFVVVVIVVVGCRTCVRYDNPDDQRRHGERRHDRYR